MKGTSVFQRTALLPRCCQFLGLQWKPSSMRQSNSSPLDTKPLSSERDEEVEPYKLSRGVLWLTHASFVNTVKAIQISWIERSSRERFLNRTRCRSRLPKEHGQRQPRLTPFQLTLKSCRQRYLEQNWRTQKRFPSKDKNNCSSSAQH